MSDGAGVVVDSFGVVVPPRIYEVTVCECFGAGLIQFEMGGTQHILSPKLAIEIAESLTRAVARTQLPMPETPE